MPRCCWPTRRGTTTSSCRSSTTWGRSGRHPEAASGPGRPSHSTWRSSCSRAARPRAATGASPRSTCDQARRPGRDATRLLPGARLLLEPLLELLAHLLFRGQVLLELLRRENASELAFLGLVEPAELAHLDERALGALDDRLGLLRIFQIESADGAGLLGRQAEPVLHEVGLKAGALLGRRVGQLVELRPRPRGGNLDQESRRDER